MHQHSFKSLAHPGPLHMTSKVKLECPLPWLFYCARLARRSGATGQDSSSTKQDNRAHLTESIGVVAPVARRRAAALFALRSSSPFTPPCNWSAAVVASTPAACFSTAESLSAGLIAPLPMCKDVAPIFG
eukprot:6206265-Pleurochrysis_carterae.AAC.2